MKADAPGAVLKRERVRDFILDLVESHQPGTRSLPSVSSVPNSGFPGRR